MIISSNQIQHVLQVYGAKRLEKGSGMAETSRVKGSGQDTVNVSEEARLLQAAMKAVREAPEEREQIVNTLGQAVRSGTYSVTGDQIAEKLLGRDLVDRLGSE
ncbi:flagellar biosynthesis anti-sigma factor FlgM [Heliobacterium chlorum]|uniref:Flagellar biosynthesis anti-sigma factor FlgM n=1 Tax=Heliobacterium chlorum TaxID=2698 RepID=A0ABR7T105_HELCL|nr:flagellar biosynthesis anti-sigma factor FlgM [Heliobacterium chlorum]MBC9784469.1 flagellar biosynthesis anti-sigma factor FlgM [Heliobacterium chlorum]